jgi:hypothetical protein
MPRAAAIFGRDIAMSGTIGLQPIPLYLNYAADESKYADASAQSNPEASSLIAYFQKVAPSIATPAALLGNYKALTVVLGAFGLQDSINNTGILKQLLTQDPKSTSSLAYKLGNAKYLAFAEALSDWSTPPFSTTSDVSQIVQSYKTNLFEQSADNQAPGLANALYFTREASSVTSVSQLQSDSNLLDVVVTGLGLPLQNFLQLSFDQQTATLDRKLNLSDLQNPTYVKRTAEQYLVSQQSDASSGPAAGSIASLYSDSSDDSGDSLLTILDPNSASGGTGDLGGSGSGNSNLLSLFA